MSAPEPSPDTVDGHPLYRVCSALRALHYRYGAGDDDYCAHCNQITGYWVPYPCKTIRVLDSALSNLPTALQIRLGVGQ